MPIYTYLCKKCGNRFDMLVRVGSDTKKPRCKKCKSTNLEKQFALFSVGGSSSKSTSSSSAKACATCAATTCSTCH